MRRRYRYNPETRELEEVDFGFSGAERRAPVATEEIVYGKAVATDGTDISTRRRHREYMAKNGLTMASDYDGGYTQRKAKEREAVFNGDGPGQRERRVQELVRALDTHKRR